MASRQPEHHGIEPVGSPVRRWLARAGRGLGLFLEIIGLREERRGEQDAAFARFRLFHAEFRKLLSANNSFLESMAELEGRLLGRQYYNISYIRRKVARLVGDVHHMIASINVISGGRFAALTPIYEQITAELTAGLAKLTPPTVERMVMDLSELSQDHRDLAGGKMANLGEIRRALGLPVPDGFVVTTAAGQMVFEENGLSDLIDKELNALLSAEDAPRVAQALQGPIMNAAVPARLAETILAAYDGLVFRSGRPTRLAVRSSALKEDSAFSFAGQFLSVLNVGREGLLPAYRRVLASLFSVEAVHYRIMHNLTQETAVMAVGVIEIVDALASGTMYSNDPNQPSPGRVVIHAVRGLGVTLADGASSPEEVTVSRVAGAGIISRTPASQRTQLVCRPDEGIAESPVPPEMAGAEILSEEEVLQLADWAKRLEDHFQGPQDIEWAMDRGRRLVLLQSRLLRVAPGRARVREPREGMELLLAAGETACPGIGTGPAVRLDEDSDFTDFPEGGVLVARRSSPKFVRLMAKARAIVTDAGSTTGHMASLAREFGVPALLNTGSATRVIVPGTVITVDAQNGFVYAGALPGGGESAPARARAANGSHETRTAAVSPELAPVMDLITPLHLTNPRSPGFTPENCRTLHDLARFIHEKSYEQMFNLGESLGDFRSASYRLDVFLPIDLYIIDLGGGVEPPARGMAVKRKHIVSAPLRALVAGMLHEKIPRFGPRPFDASGFFSLMMRHALSSPEEERTFRDPSYAMVSPVYLNYTARVGYHFGVVDSYCGQTANKNYINVLFRGGAADVIRRSRRARSISLILRDLGFSVEQSRDTVTARINKTTTAETEEKLEMIGRLMQFMRQMDLAMTSDDFAAQVVRAFAEGDYGLEKILGARGKEV